MKKLLLLILIIQNCYSLTIRTLNIEWFGRGGVISGSEKDEYRLSYLKEFLEIEKNEVDVYVLQEVTNQSLLKTLFPLHHCSSYEMESSHQYIVICVKDEIFLSSITDFSIQIGSKNLRPAHSVLIQSGKENIRIVGLHLKAGRDNTQTRIKQIKALEKGLLLKDKKVVLLGDFNTFPSYITKKEHADQYYINQILSPQGFSQEGNFKSTFLGRRSLVFDRVWTKGIGKKEIKLLGPCEEETKYKRDFYERFISDHCSIELKIGEK